MGKRPKVTIIGAGNVGSTSAMRIAEEGLADVLMIDVKKGLAEAKALDIMDAASIVGHEARISGSEDFSRMKGSSVVVVTAGFPRMPGMKREELLAKNKDIVTAVSFKIKEYARDSIVILVTNPLDVMTYVALKECGFSKKKVFGMAGDLDASRFKALLAEEINVDRASIETIVMGSHGDTMVPVISQTKVLNKPLTQVLSSKEINELIKRTKARGAEIVSLLGQGSAYYAPSAAIAGLLKDVLGDGGGIHCVSALVEGEYGLGDISIGVPAKIGPGGIGEILQVELSAEEAKALRRSAEEITKMQETITKQ